MDVSFILFMKQELNIFALFDTFWEMTTFLGIIISKIALINIKDMTTKSIYIQDIFVGNTYTKNFYIGSAIAIKYLRIDIQFFQILEVKLLGT